MSTRVLWLAVLLSLLLRFDNPLFAQEQLLPVYNFERLSSVDGLSDVRAGIVRDSSGYVWIGTDNSLARYDGYGFRKYINDPADPYSISSNYIVSLLVDSRKRLWVGTLNTGLSLYDAAHDRFINFLPHPGDSSWYQVSTIVTIFEDRSGNIWLGTWSDGIVLVLIPETTDSRDLDSLARAIRFRTYAIRITMNYPYNLCQREDGQILVPSDSGLIIIDPASHSFSHLHLSDPIGQQLDYLTVKSFCKDSHNGIWLGTSNAGLFYLNLKGDKVLNYRHREGDARTISANDIWDIIEDGRGNLWISTAQQIDIFSPNSGRNTPYLMPVSIGSGYRELTIDKSGTIWIGTYENGVYRFSPNSMLFPCYSFANSEGLPQSFESVVRAPDGTFWFNSSGKIFHIDINSRKVLKTIDVFRGKTPQFTFSDGNSTFLDRHNKYWYATWGLGLFRINLTNNEITNYRYESPSSKDCNVQRIFPGPGDSLWVGSCDDGVLKFDPHSGKFQPVPVIHPNMLLNIMEDREGKIWINSQVKGITIYDPASGTISNLLHDPSDPRSLSNDMTYKVYEDPAGRIWIGPAGNVVNLWDPATRSFTRYANLTFEHAAATIPIGTDKNGRLWLTHFGGYISVLDTSSGVFTNFDQSDGVAGGIDMENMPDGRVLLAGNGGINIFDPESLDYHRTPPHMVITRMSINDKSIAPPALIDGSYSFRLDYQQNVLEMEFAALDIDAPQLVRYNYQLEGLEKDWVNPQNHRYVRYPGLAPGDYVFRVRAASIRNDWPEQEIALNITIAPPWWQTTWAYISYVFIIIGLLITSYQLRLKQFRLKQQMDMDHFQAEHLTEMDRLKSRFFANISHEFRTPLTLILGPIEKFLSQFKDSDSQRSLNMMKRNAQQLLRLINQLLDLSKLEAGAMKLQAQLGNIVPIVKGVANSFESSAGLRNIDLVVSAEREEILIYFDHDKVEKILTNLLANAFKFTPDGGCVKVSILPPFPLMHKGSCTAAGKGERGVTITVSDNGIGIPEDKLSHIFDRFYQVDSSATRQAGGTGIGLALVKELVDMHHGTISVTSQPGVGTEFTLTLPRGSAHLKPDELFEVKIGEETTHLFTDSTVENAASLAPVITPFSNDHKPIILVVEDNADVRVYIRENLPADYRVLEAGDGAAGIEKARETIPDLIISDVMMPKIDGYELCRRLKNDEKTSHIPVILLTAKAANENKIEGLQTGADDYLIKPFEPKEVVARVNNLIKLRRKLRKRFETGVPLRTGEVAVTSMDDAFLKKAIMLLENHMSDEHFGVEEFARDLNLSRAQLHRKLIALTDLSAGNFIRYLRLHRAMELLQKNAGAVSEVAYMVGFNDPSYFSKCFHRLFGKTPGEVKNIKSKDRP